ncbi:MAG: DUF1987 domain-containing protein [Burkholderiales bacterium]|nr:DUF1987 domain-containing protein [Burkholderiales bacterium]
MENLTIVQTEATPSVMFNASSGILEIRGESYPENTAEFYAPLLQWIRDFLDRDEQPLILNIGILYFNSSSSKVLMNLFDLLDDAAREGRKIAVNWFYDANNELAIEYGEEFKEDVSALEFKLVENNVE